MRDMIIRKKMQKVVPKTGVQINYMGAVKWFICRCCFAP